MAAMPKYETRHEKSTFGIDVIKNVSLVLCDQVRNKPACPPTAASKSLERTSMIKAEILPKTPEWRSNFQMMRRVLKLVYIDSEIYWLTIRMYFGRNYAFKKEKTDFLTTHPLFSLSSSDTLSNDFQW